MAATKSMRMIMTMIQLNMKNIDRGNDNCAIIDRLEGRSQDDDTEGKLDNSDNGDELKEFGGRESVCHNETDEVNIIP